VFTTMRYDKSGTGWGHGDTLWACDSKSGNCTDFHSVFLSMARSQKVPTRFEIGFPLPADKHSAEIPGYHCWAEFYIDKMGLDSHRHFRGLEASRKTGLLLRGARRQPYSVHDGPRPETQASAGRRATQLFCLSLMEVDGKEYPNISINLSFRDVESPAAGVTASS
jgi:hypothetical protein